MRAHTSLEILGFGIIFGVPMCTLGVAVCTHILHHSSARIYVFCYYRSAGRGFEARHSACACSKALVPACTVLQMVRMTVRLGLPLGVESWVTRWGPC